MILGTACSKKSTTKEKKDKKETPAPIDPGNQSPSNPHWTSGGSAQLIQTNGVHSAALEDLADAMGLDTNSVTDLQVNLRVRKIVSGGQKLFSGDLKVGWKNVIGNSSFYQEVTSFASNDAYSAQHNKWVTHNGDGYIKMFFEFTHGAFIFIGKVENDLDKLEGKVFVHLFDYARCSYPGTYPWYGCGAPPITIPQNPPRHCWTIYYYSSTYGYNVYDCRDFIVGSGSSATVNTAAHEEPNFGRYEELGIFQTLKMTDAGLEFP
jgi:hypothetical protein